MFFLPIFQNFKNWVSKAKLSNWKKCSNFFQCRICNTHLKIVAKKSNLAKILGQMVRISKKMLILFIKILLKNTTLWVVAVHDEWKISRYIIPRYLSVLKLENYSSQGSSCAFFRKIEENLFWVIEAINKAKTTNSAVTADPKALCSILYYELCARWFYWLVSSHWDCLIIRRFLNVVFWPK